MEASHEMVDHKYIGRIKGFEHAQEQQDIYFNLEGKLGG